MHFDLEDPFIAEIDRAKTVAATRDLADATNVLADASLRQRQMLAGGYLNPFFVPRAAAQPRSR